MKLAFAGTPEFAATILRGLLDSRHEVGLVISQPDRPRGRGRKLAKPPTARLALEANLPLRQPGRIGDLADEISNHDALIVAAYGQILRPNSLHATPHGAYNVHASLLPKYRGAAPIERCIMAGETETGVSLMKMDEGLDTGPIALQLKTPIPPNMSGGELTEALANLGAEAVVQGMCLLEENSLTLMQQDSLKATYASKLENEDKVIRWGEEVGRVHDLIRALYPHIGARTSHPNWNGPVKILRSRVVAEDTVEESPGSILPAKSRILVQCGRGVLEVLELQVPGSRGLDAEDFLRGSRLEGVFLG